MSTAVNEYRLEIEDGGRKTICYFPGLSYDDFDREGGISPWKICRVFEAGRAISFFQGNFLDHREINDKSHSLFVLGGNYYFDSCLWQLPRQFQYFPYKITTELIDIGQTSATLRQIFTNTLDNKELATYYGKIVYVDRFSKRPAPFPYWLRVKYRVAEACEKVRIHTAVHEVPNTAFKNEAIIGASDMDFNKHTNQASYIRFCLDTAASATFKKHFRRLTEDICLYPILRMSVAYHSETLCGDHIVKSVWQDDLSPNTLNFSIARGNDVVFTSTMTFKETPSSKL